MRRAAALLLLLAAAPAAAAPGTSVVLVVVDALRADHLHSYGYARATTPRLDALAARGTRFSQAIAQASWTLPALSSLMTSLYPSVHGAVALPRDREWAKKLEANRYLPDADQKLGDAFPTLAEALRRSGRATIGVVSGGICRSAFGFGRGFDEYFNEGGRLEELDRIVVPWLRAHRDRPFFLYLHAGDVHEPYGGPAAGRDRWDPGYRGPVDGSRDSLRAIEAGKIPLDARTRRRLSALYDAGLSYTDEQLGALLAALDELGLSSTTVVAVTADHGEELGEHGGLVHGDTLFDEVLRVPLILAGPGVPSGTVVSAQVRAVDIAPTLLALAGAPALPDAQGQSLVPWLSGARADDLDAFSEVRSSVSLRTPALKVIEGPAGAVAYDLKQDPAERKPSKRVPPALSEKLASFRAACAALRRKFSSPPSKVDLDASTREKLKAEGYLK